MSYEELVESRKHIGDMTKEELYTYCQGLLDEVWDFEKEIERLTCDNVSLSSNNSKLAKRMIKAIEYIDLLENAFIKRNITIDYLLLDIARQILEENQEVSETTIKYLKGEDKE